MLLRLTDGRLSHPSAVILDSRTLQSTPTSSARAGYDGAKRRKGSKVHFAVDTLSNLLALHVTPANDQDQVGQLAEAIQEMSNQEVTLAYVDQGYTGQNPANAALEQGIALEGFKLPEAKRGACCYPGDG
ncbi:MAG: transposase [Zoogloea sp.]|nr:transposase [Zoogloea sp.]